MSNWFERAYLEMYSFGSSSLQKPLTRQEVQLYFSIVTVARFLNPNLRGRLKGLTLQASPLLKPPSKLPPFKPPLKPSTLPSFPPRPKGELKEVLEGGFRKRLKGGEKGGLKLKGGGLRGSSRGGGGGLKTAQGGG